MTSETEAAERPSAKCGCSTRWVVGPHGGRTGNSKRVRPSVPRVRSDGRSGTQRGGDSDDSLRTISLRPMRKRRSVEAYACKGWAKRFAELPRAKVLPETKLPTLSTPGTQGPGLRIPRNLGMFTFVGQRGSEVNER